jgi:2-polyprenyl-3-methyl-5-hydroxy-6-metoxy-1,4-benzoquinol methylase
VSGFDAFARDYRDVLDGSVGSAAYFADTKAAWLVRRLGVDFAGRVLDYGCGVGLLAAAIARALPQTTLTGFDVSQDSLGAVPAELRGKHRFVGQLEEVGGEFDVCVLANVLHHVPVGERDGLLADLAARLRPGGTLAIFEHNPWNPATRWVVAHCPFDGDAILLRSRESCQRLRRAGLRDVERAYLAFLPPFLQRFAHLDAHLPHLPLGAQYVAFGVQP